MALPTTERLGWHCGEHAARLESAECRRFLITKICRVLWHVGSTRPHARTPAPHHPLRVSKTARPRQQKAAR